MGVIFCAGVVATAAAPWLRVEWRPRSRDWDLRMAATLTFGVIASPHLFVYDLTLLVLPLFIVASRISGAAHGLPLDGGPTLRAAAMVWACGLVGPVLSLAQEQLTRRLFGFSAIVQVGVPAMLMWGVAILRVISSSRATGQPASKGIGES
jgi:hypothetical protein